MLGVVEDLLSWVLGIGFWVGVPCLFILAHRFEKRKKQRAADNYLSALQAVSAYGRFAPTLHSPVGEKGQMLIATDAETTKIALVPLDTETFRVSLLPFSDILDITYGEKATVRNSNMGMILPIDGLDVLVGSGSTRRTVTSRWLNIFVDNSADPRITLLMPNEIEAQKWFDLVRLGITRHQRAEQQLQKGA